MNPTIYFRKETNDNVTIRSVENNHIIMMLNPAQQVTVSPDNSSTFTIKSLNGNSNEKPLTININDVSPYACLPVIAILDENGNSIGRSNNTVSESLRNSIVTALITDFFFEVVDSVVSGGLQEIVYFDSSVGFPAQPLENTLYIDTFEQYLPVLSIVDNYISKRRKEYFWINSDWKEQNDNYWTGIGGVLKDRNNVVFLGNALPPNSYGAESRFLIKGTSLNSFFGMASDGSLFSTGRNTNVELSNTIFGYKSQTSALSSGLYNTAFGFSTLQNNSLGSYNTAIGGVALKNNNTGNYNTAIGINALSQNINGSFNTAIGFNAQGNTISSVSNVAIGYRAGQNAESTRSIYIGHNSGFQFEGGNSNIVIGQGNPYGPVHSFGTGNILIGTNVCESLTTGQFNTIVGNTEVYMSSGLGNLILCALGKVMLGTGSSNVVIGPYNSTSILDETMSGNILISTNTIAGGPIGGLRIRIDEHGTLTQGDRSPNWQSACVDLSHNSSPTGYKRGFLKPTLTTTEMNAIPNPTAGLEVYNKTTNRPAFYNGTSWIIL